MFLWCIVYFQRLDILEPDLEMMVPSLSRSAKMMLAASYDMIGVLLQDLKSLSERFKTMPFGNVCIWSKKEKLVEFEKES